MTSNTQAECPTCQGFGELPRLNGMIDGEGMMERCPTCHGTGKLPVPQEAFQLQDTQHDKELERAKLGTRQTRPAPQEAETLNPNAVTVAKFDFKCPRPGCVRGYKHRHTDTPTTEVREADGRYGFDGNWERLCVCGHTLGIHAARNDTGKRPCFNDDSGAPGATGEPCDCQHFKPSRRKPAPTAPQEPAGDPYKRLYEIIKAAEPLDCWEAYDQAIKPIQALLDAEYQRGKTDGAREELKLANAWSLGSNLSVASKHKWARHHADRLASLDQGGE